MPFAAWPVYADDVGDKISGTIINKALLDAIKTDIEADVFSTAYPTVKPRTIIDEVVQARGTLASVDARLDVSLNNDGTLKPITGLATETELLSQLAQRNLVRNGNLDTYLYMAADTVPPGLPLATNPPDGWTIAGGPALQRCGPGEADGTSLGTGQYCERLIAGGIATVSQLVIPAAEATDHHVQLETRKVQFYCVYQAAGANAIQLEVVDGGATTTGAWLPAAVTPTLATLDHTVNGGWTGLTVTVRIAAGATVYIGGLGLMVGDLEPIRWPYEPGLWYKNGTQRVAGFNNLAHGNVGGAWQDVWTLLGGIPANALSNNNAIRVQLSGTMANSVNQKVIRIYLNTHYVAILDTVVASGVAGTIWTFEGYIMQTSYTAASLVGLMTFNQASLAAPTVWHVGGAFAGGAINFANNTPLRIALYGAVNPNEIVLQQGLIEVVKF